MANELLKAEDGKRISQLDGLRGFLALFVLVFHCLNHQKTETFLDRFFYHYVSNIVPAFFMLSTILLLMVFETRLLQKSRPFLKFYIGRAFRILPLWYLVCAWLWYQNSPVDVVLAQAFFVFGFLTFDNRYLPLPVAWSLFIEEMFYLVFPAIRALFKWPLNVVLALAFWVLKIWTMYYWTSNGLSSFYNSQSWLITANIHYFFIGSVLYSALSNPKQALDDFLNRKIFWKFTALDFSIFITFAAILVDSWLPNEVVALLLTLIAFAKAGACRWAVDNPLLRWVGVRCYGVYILHSLVLRAVTQQPQYNLWIESFSNLGKGFFLLGVVMILTLAVAGLTFFLLEQPAMRLGKKLAARSDGKV